MITQLPYQITHFFEFNPTKSQEKVINDLYDFLVTDSEHPIFVLRGYAGTGKSSLIGAFAKMLVANGLPVELLAPTGRAAKVLQSYCGMPAHTIHRVIYREKIMAGGVANYDKGYNRSRPGTIYIIDEASMISNSDDGLSPFGSGHLLEDLLDYCFSVDSSKVLMMGDDAQLPPVGTEISPAMDPSYLRSYCSDLFVGALTDIVRQDESGEIVALSHILRSIIIDMASSGDSVSSPLLPLPSAGEIKIISGYDLPDLIESSYSRVGQEETVLITRSNKDAEDFNRQIRYRTLDLEDEVVSGEQVMVCRNNYFTVPRDEQGHPQAAFIANGELLSVERSRRTHELHGFTFREAELRDGDGGIINGLIILESLYSGTSSLTPEQRQALFESVAADYPMARTRRELYQCVRKDPYLNALQIKYPYAMTCHKAQGGQWREVYIHFGYLTEEMIDLSFCRWLYTAMTRATDRLYIINPPECIFGKIEYE